MSDIVSRLPPEISLRIVQLLPPYTLTLFEVVCSTWLQLVREHEDMIYSRLAQCHIGPGNLSFKLMRNICAKLRYASFGRSTWDEVYSWKALCSKQYRLSKNRTKASMYLSRIYLNNPRHRRFWKFRVDLKDRLILTTYVSSDMRVYDLDSMVELFVFRGVNHYNSLEYDSDTGTVVFNRGKDLEICRLRRCPPGQSQSLFTRGQFTKWITIPTIPGMRGFHLKDGILSVISQLGTTTYYDLLASYNELVFLRMLHYNGGITGHVDEAPSVLDLRLRDLIMCSSPLTGSPIGTFPPLPPNSLVHYTVRRPQRRKSSDELLSAEVVYIGIIEMVDFEDIRPAASYGGKEWKACYVDGPYLVILSDMSRLFVCTDYEAVLRTPEGKDRGRLVRSTCCVFDIEVGEIDTDLVEGMERYTGDVNCLSVCDGRAAFGAIDHIIILPFPTIHSTTYPESPKALCLPTASSVEVSCLLLVPDALITIWGYKQRISLSSSHSPTVLRNAIRIIWFDARQGSIQEKERKRARRRTPDEIDLELEEFDSDSEISHDEDDNDEEDHEEEDDDEGQLDEAWVDNLLDFEKWPYDEGDPDSDEDSV